MDREDWKRRFRERGLVPGGEPDPTVVAEVETSEWQIPAPA